MCVLPFTAVMPILLGTQPAALGCILRAVSEWDMEARDALAVVVVIKQSRCLNENTVSSVQAPFALTPSGQCRAV